MVCQPGSGPFAFRLGKRTRLPSLSVSAAYPICHIQRSMPDLGLCTSPLVSTCAYNSCGLVVRGSPVPSAGRRGLLQGGAHRRLGTGQGFARAFPPSLHVPQRRACGPPRTVAPVSGGQVIGRVIRLSQTDRDPGYWSGGSLPVAT